ncbi:MAG: glycosyltransferase family 2 protein [Chlorobium sp.]|nr:glycosyltransferase family 2 protein [Chlorobium sp.]
MNDVSIIIVNWNTIEILRGCLFSVYLQTHDVRYEVFVIDNASADSSAEMVKIEFPQVKLIENSENRGFAAANNQGMRIANGRYVLLLNPDTIILDGAIQKSVELADKRPDIGVLGCQVWLNEHEIQKTCFAFPTIWGALLQETGLLRMLPHSRIFGSAYYGWWDRKSEMDVDVVSGMFMLVRQEAIQEVGLMDEDYFVYAEETDWCFRFHKAGWRCVFSPIAKIIHLDGGSKSTALIKNKMFVQMQKSMLIFHLKQHGWWAWIARKGLYIFSMFFRYIIYSMMSLLSQHHNIQKKIDQSRAAINFHLLGIEPK